MHRRYTKFKSSLGLRSALIAVLGITLVPALAVLPIRAQDSPVPPNLAEPAFRQVAFQETTEAKEWTEPEILLEQLSQLESVPEATQWATQTAEAISSLSEIGIESSEFDNAIGKVETLYRQAFNVVSLIANRPQSVAGSDLAQVYQANYSLARRIDVWKSARLAFLNNQNFVEDLTISFTDGPVYYEGLDPRWVDYLLLAELNEKLTDEEVKDRERREAAREVLARLNSPVLKPNQIQYVYSVMDARVLKQLRTIASEPVDYFDLAKRVENYEKQPTGFAGYFLNNQYQNLLWSDRPADKSVAEMVNVHYRNSNFHLAVSNRLIDQLVPSSLPTTVEPVEDEIQGAKVTGTSTASNQIKVKFIPDASKAVIQFETYGQVLAQTVAERQGFKIQNVGNAEFAILKRISISPNGIDSSERPQTSVAGQQQVLAITSQLDDIPIAGCVARKFAEKKLEKDSDMNRKIFENKVSASAERKVETQVQQRVSQMRNRAKGGFLQTLTALELEPEPLRIYTTSDQYFMNFRLAGRDQMAANTQPHSMDPNAYLAFQFHQSAINNLIQRVDLNARKFTANELKNHLREFVGQPELTEEEMEESAAEFEFAAFDPIRIEFKDDRLVLTLNLKGIKLTENGKTWRNVSLTTGYKLISQGLKLKLEQDDSLTRIRGRRMRVNDKAAMSTLMKVLLKKEYEVNALPEKMAGKIGGESLWVSDLKLGDGWIGITINEHSSPGLQINSPAGVEANFSDIPRNLESKQNGLLNQTIPETTPAPVYRFSDREAGRVLDRSPQPTIAEEVSILNREVRR